MRVLDALVSQDFCRVADSQRSDGNRVRLLCDGPEAFPAWLDAIGSATSVVHLENYILQEDDVGRRFADALLAAAGRGARVRVIYDWMGCLPRTSGRFWRRLTDGGIDVRRYNPPRLRNPLGWISRDHRKVLCVDGRVAFTGGLCIGHDWVGDPAKGVPPWRDTAIQIEGPAVAQIDAAFADSWASIGGEPQQDQPPIHVGDGRSAATGGVGVSVIAGRPRGGGLYRLEQLIAEVAERSLWLTDGYFVATTAYVRALAGAARAGVDVRLLVPGSSNWPVVGAMSKLAYRPLLEAGVRVFEWNGPMVHAKTAVADGRLTRIGSSNSNLASWISNRELDVTVVDDVLAGQMQATFERDQANSTEVKLETGARALAGTDRPWSDAAAAGRLFSGAIGLGHTLGASLSQDRRLGSSDSAVLLGGGLLLLATGLLAVLAPRLIAYPIGVAALWFAAGLLLHAWKLRRGNRGADTR